MSCEQIIERYIIEELTLGNQVKKIEFDESLFSKGILDSLSLLKLILFIESQFGLIVEDGDVVPENFESVHRICDFIVRKKNKS